MEDGIINIVPESQQFYPIALGTSYGYMGTLLGTILSVAARLKNQPLWRVL